MLNGSRNLFSSRGSEEPAAGGHWQDTIKRAPLLVGLSLLVAVILTPILLYAGYAATFLDRMPVRASVRAAFDRGDFPDNFELNTHFGSHPLNDCMILGMIIDTRGSRWRQVLAPETLTMDRCGKLRDEVNSPGEKYEIRARYTRYMNGNATVVTPIIRIMGVKRSRLALMIANYAALLLVLIISLWRIIKKLTKPQTIIGGNPLGLDAILTVSSAIMLLGFGIQYFDVGFGHGVSDLVLTGYLLSITLLDPAKLSTWALVVLHAIFGVLTMWTEILTGGLPMGLCLIFFVFSGLVGRQGFQAVQTSLYSVLAFGFAAVAAALIKLAVTVHLIGLDVLNDYVAELGVRAGAPASSGMLIRHSIKYLEYIAGGSLVMGIFALTSAAIGFGLSVVVLCKQSRRRNYEALLAGLAGGSIILWCVAFAAHFAIHAYFMDRILIGFIIASTVLVASTFKSEIGLIVARLAEGTTREAVPVARGT